MSELKPTKRMAFNFLRSYFDVLNKIENDSQKLDFLLSIINKQFLDQDPKELDFIVELCYESQRHAIEKSVKGWKTANKTDLLGNPIPPCTPPLKGNPTPPLKEEQEKGKEKGKEEYNNASTKVDFNKLLLRFNNITNKKTRVVNKKVKRQIVARLKEGYTKQDIITAIESCYNDDYHKETEHKYLTLEFITRADKLDKYSQIKNQHVATTGRFKGYKVGDRFENRTVTRISDKGEAVFVNDKDIL